MAVAVEISTLNGIELTDAQKAKVDEIQAKYQPEMQAIRESMQSGGDRAEALPEDVGAPGQDDA